MIKSLITSIALGFAAATPAFASVEWEWQFNSGANPTGTDLGPPGTATINVGAFGTGWHNNDFNLGSATGYWDLGKNGSVILLIPNLASPTASFNATLSIVQWIDGPLYTGNLTYSLSGGTQVRGVTTHLIEATTHGSLVEYDTVWHLLASSNPVVFTITAPTTGAIFDRITVVPEPTTIVAGALLLLPFGVSTLRIFRRRNSQSAR